MAGDRIGRLVRVMCPGKGQRKGSGEGEGGGGWTTRWMGSLCQC